jgi:uncharacterized protein
MRALRLGSVAIALLLGTGACLGLGGGQSPATRFYVLTPQAGAPAAAPAPVGAALSVGPVSLPGYLDRPQIVTRSGSDQVQFAEFDRWAEPLPDSVPRLLSEDLETALPAMAVARGPAPAAAVRQFQLAVSVSRFDGALGGDVVLEARWRLSGPEQQVQANRFSRIVERTGGAGYDALVAAMSRALGRLAHDMAAAVGSLAQGREAA